MHSSGLSRHDTLPAEDTSWSYSRVPGQPAPIPPRNEPLLYIHNSNVDNLHATALCLKNLQLKVPPTPSERTLNDARTDGTSTDIHAETMISAINFPQVCTFNRVLLLPHDRLTIVPVKGLSCIE
jgi:hypothetical protein